MATRAEIEMLMKLRDEMSAKLDGLTKRVDTFEKKTQKSTGRISEFKKGLNDAAQRVTGFNIAALGMAGAVAGVAAGIAKATIDTIHLGEQLVNLSSKTGLTIQEIQELQFAAEQSGTNFDQLSNAVQRLGRRVAAELPEATKFLDKLGFTVDDIVSRDPGEAFALVADKIGQIKSPAEQAAAAMGIFGDAGLQVLPAINQGLTDNIERFRELGAAMSDETAQAAKKLADDLTDLKTQFNGIKITIGAAVIPALSNMLKFFSDLLPGAIQTSIAWILDFVNHGVKAQARLAEAWALLPDAFGGDVFAKAADGINDISLKIEKLSAEFRDKANKNFKQFTQSLVETEKKAPGATVELGRFGDEAKKTDVKVKSLAVTVEEMQKLIRKGLGAPGTRELDLAVALPPSDEVAMLLAHVQEGIDRTNRWEEAQKAYNEEVARAADLIRILPGPLGDVVALTTSAVSSLKQLSTLGSGNIFGGLKEAFLAGKGTGNGILDILGGISGVAGFAGPLISVGTSAIKALGKLFQGRTSQTVMEEAGRDLGASISESMAEEIHKGGKNVQLAIADIFESGGFTDINRFAEEVGDIFSGLDQGLFSSTEATEALSASTSILTENIGELGESGVLQMERILAAAAETGVGFANMDEFAQAYVARARELGVAVNDVALSTLGLGDALNQIGESAPKTMEEISAQFGITNDEVRALGRELGINVQTNLERMANSLGLSVEQFRQLGQAVQEQYGIPLEDVDDLLSSMGVSAEELGTALGVDLGGVTDATDAAAQNTQRAAEAATWYADELERAMRAVSGISFPAIPTPGIPSFADGAFVPKPTLAVVGDAPGGEFVVPAGEMGNSSSINIVNNVDLRGSFGMDEAQIADAITNMVREGIQRNTSGLQSEVRTQAKDAVSG